MALDVTPIKKGVEGDKRYCYATVTFDSSYTGGEGEALTLGEFGFSTDFYHVQFEDVGGYRFTVNHSLDTVRVAKLTVENEASATGVLDDDDSAAANGVQVYVVVDEQDFIPGFALGHFEFVSPTNANGSVTLFNGGPQLTIFDSDAAATNGVAVRIIAAGGGFEATLAGSQDPVLVPTSGGKYVKVVDLTTGSTPPVFCDEDAANTYERLQAVVVDNANETFSFVEAPRESVVQQGTDLSALVVRVKAEGV